MFFKFLGKIGQVFKKSAKDIVIPYSAYAAFFIIISFIPFIMLLLTLVQFLPFTANEFVDYLCSNLPNALNTIIKPLINGLYEAGGGMISLAAIGAIWAASMGMNALINSLNRIYGVNESRPYVYVRGMSIIYTILFMLLLITTLVLFLFSKILISLLKDVFPLITMLSWLKYLFIPAFMFVIFMLVFCFLPNRKCKIKKEIPGAIVCTIGWTGFSLLYSYYMDNFNVFPTIYGSLAAIVFIMLWLFFCLYITLMSAEINSINYNNNIWE